MKKYDVAVIMTVHNRKKKTLSCLEKLFASRSGNFKLTVFLTDDGSSDGTADVVNDRFTNVHIIHGDGSLYWNRGMLEAWKYAAKKNPDFFLWLNDDTHLKQDALNAILRFSESVNHEAIIVGSTYDNEDNIRLSYGGRCANKKHTIIFPDEHILKECATFNGNIVLIPQSVFKKMGFNDPFFHHSFGDIEYGLRASKLGIKSYIAPGYYGACERNNPIPIFRRKGIPFWKRYKLLYSPLGFNPLEDFYLNRKYYPLYKAVLWFLKLHLNVLFVVDHTKRK